MDKGFQSVIGTLGAFRRVELLEPIIQDPSASMIIKLPLHTKSHVGEYLLREAWIAAKRIVEVIGYQRVDRAGAYLVNLRGMAVSGDRHSLEAQVLQVNQIGNQSPEGIDSTVVHVVTSDPFDAAFRRQRVKRVLLVKVAEFVFTEARIFHLELTACQIEGP